MVSSQAATLVGTAVTLGVVHVLTGPDHLSAIATLSANVNNSKGLAFWLGIRWGIGHSTGLITVAVIFIVMSLSSDDGDGDVINIPDAFSNFFEGLVGIFMILLGAYGVRKAWKKRPIRGEFPPTEDSLFEDPMSPPEQLVRLQKKTEMQKIVPFQQQQQQHSSEQAEGSAATWEDEHNADEEQHSSEQAEGSAAATWEDEHNADEADDGDSSRDTTLIGTNRCCSCFDALTLLVPARAMAFGAGVVHGLAGPGGIMGVIPAVQLHDARLATLYLSFFCISSTLTMGLFAAFYGACSARLARRSSDQADEENNEQSVLEEQASTTSQSAGRREFWIECASACLSILVGITWLALLSIGKLDDVFG